MKKLDSKTNGLIYSIALIVIGALFCIFRTGAVDWMLTLVGAVIIVYGVFDVIQKEMVKGIIEIAVGALIVIFAFTILQITLLILGIVLLAYGIYSLVLAFPKFGSAKGILNKIVVLVNPAILIVVGILLVISKFAFVDWICIVIGVILIANGVWMLIKNK